MSNKTCFLYSLFLIFFSFTTQPSYCQGNKISIKEADNLFANRKYAQSFEIYQQILKKQQKYSPKMLLKMAYIQENLKNYTATLYYLHLYHNKIPNRAVLQKIDELARKQNYAGYEYSDLDFFQTQFNKLYLDILEALLTIAVISIPVLFYLKKRHKLPSKPFQVGFVVYLLFTLYYVNFLNFSKKGIIRQGNVAVMSAPAAGASWLATATEGHKINLTGEQDIWYETEWNGKKAYIRKKNILELP